MADGRISQNSINGLSESFNHKFQQFTAGMDSGFSRFNVKLDRFQQSQENFQQLLIQQLEDAITAQFHQSGIINLGNGISTPLLSIPSVSQRSTLPPLLPTPLVVRRSNLPPLLPTPLLVRPTYPTRYVENVCASDISLEGNNGDEAIKEEVCDGVVENSHSVLELGGDTTHFEIPPEILLRSVSSSEDNHVNQVLQSEDHFSKLDVSLEESFFTSTLGKSGSTIKETTLGNFSSSITKYEPENVAYSQWMFFQRNETKESQEEKSNSLAQDEDWVDKKNEKFEVYDSHIPSIHVITNIENEHIPKLLSAILPAVLADWKSNGAHLDCLKLTQGINWYPTIATSFMLP